MTADFADWGTGTALQLVFHFEICRKKPTVQYLLSLIGVFPLHIAYCRKKDWTPHWRLVTILTYAVTTDLSWHTSIVFVVSPLPAIIATDSIVADHVVERVVDYYLTLLSGYWTYSHARMLGKRSCGVKFCAFHTIISVIYMHVIALVIFFCTSDSNPGRICMSKVKLFLMSETMWNTVSYEDFVTYQSLYL